MRDRIALALLVCLAMACDSSDAKQSSKPSKPSQPTGSGGANAQVHTPMAYPCGSATQLAKLEDSQAPIVVAAGFVYFATKGGIHRVPTRGGAVETLVPDVGATHELAIAVAATGALYWLASDGVDGRVFRRKAGGSTEQLAKLAELARHADPRIRAAMVLTDTSIVVGSGRAVVSMPLSGTPVTKLLEIPKPEREFRHALAVDKTSVYALTPLGIEQVPRAGGQAQRIVGEAEDRGLPDALVGDGTALYWLANQAVMKRPLDTAAAVDTKLAHPYSPPAAIGVAGGTVYYGQMFVDGSSILTSTAGPSLACNGGQAISIAADDQQVYWTDGNAVYAAKH